MRHLHAGSDPNALGRYSIASYTIHCIPQACLRAFRQQLDGIDWKAGNWNLSELLERLEAVGVSVVLVDDSQRLQ
jgi:hypothetical protein